MSIDEWIYTEFCFDNLDIDVSFTVSHEDVHQNLQVWSKITEQEDIFHSLEIKFDLAVGKRITLCQQSYIKRINAILKKLMMNSSKFCITVELQSYYIHSTEILTN